MAKKKKKKNEAAVALGRLGGKVKVPKGFATLTPERRRQVAADGLAARRAAAESRAGK